MLLFAATAALTLTLSLSSLGFFESHRVALFQVVSIMTTTGFSSANFELWSPFAQLLLLALMFAGGCTGSTAGGMKVARLVLLFRVVGREFRRIVERRGVFAVRFNAEAVSENAIQSLLNLVYIAFLINFAACMALTALGVDVLTAISAVAASMFNIGPGLGDVGPSENYAQLVPLVKWVLSFCMLAGRLEYYTPAGAFHWSVLEEIAVSSSFIVWRSCSFWTSSSLILLELEPSFSSALISS